MILRMVTRFLIACAVLAMSTIALAQDGLAGAKAQGLIGERPDGLVALVASGTPELQAMVARVNAQRVGISRDRVRHRRAARSRTGAGRPAIIERLPQGQYFMDASGRWRQK